jgi:ligand-binding SRPBCC domain-containing protein
VRIDEIIKDMGTVRVTLQSRLAARPEELWEWITSARGVNAEMRPILKLDFPKGMTHIPQDADSLGKKLGDCRFLLFGVLPVDLSRLTFVEIEPGRRFVEQSPLLSMKGWRHERTIAPDGDGMLLVDELEFTPRFAAGAVGWFITRFFRHRHAALRRRFPAAPVAPRAPLQCAEVACTASPDATTEPSGSTCSQAKAPSAKPSTATT